MGDGVEGVPLGPIAWARMFEKLLEAREVKTGQSNQHTASVTVTEAAKEAGVSPRTAERRMKVARDLEPYPEIAEEVDTIGGSGCPTRPTTRHHGGRHKDCRRSR